VRGQDAIVVAAGAPRVRLPDRPPETDRHAVTADVRVEADGSASLEIVEEFHGESAVGFRQRLEQIPDAELRRGMEQGYVPRVVPGGSLREFRIEGREDPSRPIVLTFSIDVRAFGRRVGHRLALPPLFPAGLAASYASLPSRTTAEIVSSGSSTVTIRLRTSGRLGPAPPAVHLRGPGRSSYSIAARRRGDALEVVRTVVLERTQVTPADYPAFATFCRRADEADESEISVTLR
jgi:hypothetical protein